MLHICHISRENGLGSIALSIALPVAPGHGGVAVTRWVESMLRGLQAKLLLTQLPDGSWARPANGTPSTDIAKPDPLAFPGLVVDEAFSLALAGAAGFQVPDFEVRTDWVDRPVLVLCRYDRLVTAGTVTRIHQEDGSAALGMDPTGRMRYQSQDPRSPSLRKIATLLRRHGQRWITDFASMGQDVILRVAVGDTDGHSRNYSFLHTGDAIKMAPIYDVAPTHLHVASKHLGLYVHDQPYLAHVIAEHLAEEIHGWGVPKSAAADLVVSSLEQLAAALPDAALRVPNVSARTVDSVASRIEKLLRSA